MVGCLSKRAKSSISVFGVILIVADLISAASRFMLILACCQIIPFCFGKGKNPNWSNTRGRESYSKPIWILWNFLKSKYFLENENKSLKNKFSNSCKFENENRKYFLKPKILHWKTKILLFLELFYNCVWLKYF